MKHIKMLPDVVCLTMSGEILKNENGVPVIFTHKGFIEGRLCDPQLGTDSEGVIAAFEMRKQLHALEDGPYLSLESSHFKKLHAVTDKPSPQAQYNPGVAFNLVPYIKSITEHAVDELPEG